jgi:putative endonuclease
MPYFVYMLQCEDGSFYTGYTRNVKRRFRLHMMGKGARYTRVHKPTSLAYVERFTSRSEAMKREKKVKRMSHARKDALKKSQP